MTDDLQLDFVNAPFVCCNCHRAFDALPESAHDDKNDGWNCPECGAGNINDGWVPDDQR